MRHVLAFLPVVALLACGDGRPTEFEKCSSTGEMRCGHSTAHEETALACQGGTWFQAGFGGENRCAAACEDSGAGTVSCAGVTYGRVSTTSGATICDGSVEFACDILGQAVVKCVEGAWTTVSSCDTGKTCAPDANGLPVCKAQ